MIFGKEEGENNSYSENGQEFERKCGKNHKGRVQGHSYVELVILTNRKTFGQFLTAHNSMELNTGRTS